jgi:hypothetical protein
MGDDWILDAGKYGRADARAGLPISRDYVADDDDCSAEAMAYLRAHSAERARIAAAEQHAARVAAE